MDTGQLHLFLSILVIEMINRFELLLFEKHRLEKNGFKLPHINELNPCTRVFRSHFD